jgi:beta-mannanase
MTMARIRCLTKQGPGVVVALLLLAVPVGAMVTRGEKALAGVLWGYEYEVFRLCDRLPMVCKGWREKVSVNLGLYEPTGEYGDKQASEYLAIEHVFLRWDAYQASELTPRLERAARARRWVLVTVEPWPAAGRDGSGSDLFATITAGASDKTIRLICSDIAASGRPVFVRWGHEMEDVKGRYPWARDDSVGYVRAYRHFVDRCRSVAERVFYVWSPAGNKGLAQYWPGRPYADYIGVSIYGFPEWDRKQYGKIRSFDEIFGEKYERIKDLDRPVMIAEMGVTGGRQHQVRWLAEAVRSFQKYPGLKSVVYYNARDHREAWPTDVAVPDWRVSMDDLVEVARMLQR